MAPPSPVSQEAAGFRHPWGFVGSATFGPLTDYTELGASLCLFNRLMASCHRQGTLFAISSVLHDFISVLSKKKTKPTQKQNNLGIFLDYEYYIGLKQVFKDQKIFLPALLRYWTFIQARTFIGACSNFSNAEHLPSKALLLNQNTLKSFKVFSPYSCTAQIH